MKRIRKLIPYLFLFVFCLSQSVSVAEAAEASKDQFQDPSTQSSTLQATVAASSASYYVEIPEEIGLGTLRYGTDMNQPYTIRVTLKNESGKDQVTVSSDEQFSLARLSEKSSSELPCHNSFPVKTFGKSGKATGNITIYQEDIAKAAQGRYSGVLHFYIRYEHNSDSPADPDKPDQPVVPPTKPTDPIPPTDDIPTPGPAVPETDRTTRYICDVSMRKENHFSQKSMCDALFYQKADITCTGDQATLTLYVIDPIPSYPDEGTPLSKIKMQYQGKNYGASVKNSRKVVKSFSTAPGFIPKAGNYAATPVTVTLPMSAIKESVNQKLTCSAYINAVMKVNQTFYVVLSNLVQTSSPVKNVPVDDSFVSPIEEMTEDHTQNPSGMLGANSETAADEMYTDEEMQQQSEHPRYKIITSLFPQLFGFILFTVLIMGAAFTAYWLRLSRKD